MKTTRRNRARWLVYFALGALVFALLNVAFERISSNRERGERSDAHVQAAELERSQSVIRIAAPPPSEATISGTVYGANATRLAGSSVCVSCAGCNPFAVDSAPRCTQTGPDGRYAFEDVPPGEHFVSASALGHTPKFANDGKPVSVPDEHATPISELDISLPAGGETVSGVVRDATGGTVQGATVQVISGNDDFTTIPTPQTTTTDEQGRFVVSCRPGPVELLAMADGYASGVAARIAPATDVELIVTPPSRIEGIVVTDKGQPVANIRVLAEAQLAPAQQAASDASGRFAIQGLNPGVYKLRAIGEGWFGAHPATITLSLADRAREVVVTVWKGAAIRGTLLAEDGRPCTQGTVHLAPRVPTYALPTFEASSMSRGEVSFPAVLAGSYQVNVSCRDSGLQLAEPLEVASADQSGLVWKAAERSLSVEGRVVDGRARPVSDVVLALQPKGPQGMGTRTVATLADGSFAFKGVAAGAYTLGSRDLAEGLPVELRDRSITGLSLVVKPVGFIAVRALGPDGSPIDGLSVRATDAQGEVSGFPSELGNGMYRLGPLPIGSYAVEVSDGINPQVRAGGPSAVTRVASGETTRVDVQYGGYRGRIAGRVLDESGAGVENVWVQAKPADAQGDPFADMQQLKLLREGRRALSDVEGRFELHGLAESGTFVVTAQWPLGGEAKVEGVRAGGAIDLLLQALGSLSGTAVNAEGQPVVQLSLQLSNAQTGQQRAEVLFAPGGQWRIDNVTPGPLQLIANDPHRNVAMASWTLSPKQKLTGLRLEFRPAEAHAANSVADE